MKILGIDHLGMVAKDHSKAMYFFNRLLGLDVLGGEVVDSEKVKVDFLKSFSNEVNAETRIELLEDEGGGPIARYKERFGGGIHHIAFKVDNVKEYFEFFKQNDVKLVSKSISYGAGGHKIIFVHPSATGGFLVEFSEVAHD